MSLGSRRRCTWCRKAQNEVFKLIAGPGSFICDQCVKVCREQLKRGAEAKTEQQDLYFDCSFCGQSRRHDAVVTGPGVRICDECVGLCEEILTGVSRALPESQRTCSFCESADGRRVFSEGRTSICAECVREGFGLCDQRPKGWKPEPPVTGEVVSCSFCRKQKHEVWHLIAGAKGTICDGCVVRYMLTVRSLETPLDPS